MTTYESALATILADARPLPLRLAPVDSDLRGVLAREVAAPIDLPPFDNSAVDGYAVRLPIEGPLLLVGETSAGQPAGRPLQPGEAIRIFTGAPIPPGTHAVVMQEDVSAEADRITVPETPRPSANIRRQGEELHVGAPVLPAGHVVTPATIGVLATLGLTEVAVSDTPRIGIVATGNELVPPGQPLAAGQVYASNGVALAAAARALGVATTVAHAVDDPGALREALAEALTSHDIVITAGGVSVGAYDYVRSAWRELGLTERFWRVAIKPGKPVLFGIAPNGSLAFGLPGNPVSALVTFHLFVRPAIRAMQGLPPEPPVSLRLGSPVRGSVGRDDFVRVQLVDGLAFPLERQGSHMASGLALADALVRIPAGATLDAGSVAPAIRLNWT
ncbi:MAG: gephyrin-like molybdotransferase Glp [Fimbriimonas sp.]